jgi:hypothetical protein
MSTRPLKPHRRTTATAMTAAALTALLAFPGATTAQTPSQTAAAAATPGDRIVIYRCTDAKGRLALRDSPCLRGERQDVRNMVRPKDAPRAAYAPIGNPPQSAGVSTQLLIVQPARPLYECSGQDDSGRMQTYLSDSPEGKLRWVPQPAIVLTHLPVYDPNSGFVQIGEYGLPNRPLVYDNGSWVRDRCYALPQTEVCARLRDERSQLGRRRFNAQQTERAQINREERSIEARLAQDCS